MANIYIQVRVGKHPDFMAKGRAYHFSIGDLDSKIPDETIQNLVEEAIQEKFIAKFGSLYEPQ